MPLTCRVTINFEVTIIVTCKNGYENSQPEQYNRWWTWTQLEHISCDGKSQVSANLHKTAKKTHGYTNSRNSMQIFCCQDNK